MILFNQILTETTLSYKHGTEIAQEEVIKILQEHCTAFLKHKECFFRGVHSTVPYMVDSIPEGTHRKSLDNQLKICNAVIDNTWANYPKRSRSVIMASSFVDTVRFGNQYVAIPYDNALLAVAPKPDMMDIITPEGFDLEEIQEFIVNVVTKGDPYRFDSSVAKLEGAKLFEFIKREFAKPIDIDEFIRRGYSQIDVIDVIRNLTFEKVVQWLSPKNLGVDLIQYDFSFQEMTGRHEIWTESPVVLIAFNEYKRIFP